MKQRELFFMRRRACSLVALLAFAALSGAPVRADDMSPVSAPDAWTMTFTPQYSYGRYNNSPARDSVSSATLYAAAQYLEAGGVAVSASSTTVKMLAGLPTLDQSSGFISGYLNFTPDLLSGQLTLRGDVLRADNNDASNETNGVTAYAPQVSFLNFAKTYYLDLGYAASRYGDSSSGNGSLAVTQWTPTFGFALNDGYDWLQLRGYDIRFSNSQRAQNNSATDAVEMKWIHYFSATGWMPEQVQLGALFGQRIYAVDSGNVYNLADMQQGGVSLAANWLLDTGLHLLLQCGQERYAASGGSAYTGTYAYLAISEQW
jgi:hypothetical protein